MDNSKLLQDITYYTRLIQQHTQRSKHKTTNYYHKNKFMGSNAWTNRTPTINAKYKFVKKETEPIPPPPQPQPPPVEDLIQVKPKSTITLINPHFKQKIHINPNFKQPIQLKKSSIYVNPKVLQKDVYDEIPKENIKVSSNIPPPEPEKKITLPAMSHTSKYKLVRNANQTPKIHIDIKSNNVIKSKYKVDRRGSRKTVASPKKKLVWKKQSSTNIIRIGGVLYRKSVNKLQKTSNPKDGRKIILVKSPANGIQKKLILRRTKLRNVTLKTKHNKIIKAIAVTPMKSSSKKLILRKNVSFSKLRKNNIPCPIYCRYGKCSSHDKGNCRRLHDPKYINVCKKFLKGLCEITGCPLSHSVILEKMPTCKYYLEGFCGREPCPYLHVKLNSKAEICKKFLQGFCEAAAKCDKKHIYACPEMERGGKCNRPKCPYPHKVSSSVGKKIVTQSVVRPSEKFCASESTIENNDRYFIKSDNVGLENETEQNSIDATNSCPLQHSPVNDEDDRIVIIPKKHKIQSLPDFIPFD